MVRVLASPISLLAQHDTSVDHADTVEASMKRAEVVLSGEERLVAVKNPTARATNGLDAVGDKDVRKVCPMENQSVSIQRHPQATAGAPEVPSGLSYRRTQPVHQCENSGCPHCWMC